MTPPIRNITDASPGQITATPANIERKLAIKLTKITGYKGKKGRRS
jgi:hypothetical protein